MGIVALASVKGAPGVTTVAAALAACWPGSAALLVEADPAGGDLAARFGHPDTPGLSSLVAAARHGHVDPRRHIQRLPLGFDAVLAPGGLAARAAVAVLATRIPVLRGAARPVVVDLGRLPADGPALPLAAAAEVVLLVVAPRLDALANLSASLGPLRGQLRTPPQLVLAGDGPFTAGEISRNLGLAVAGQVPFDRPGAGILTGQHTPGRGWRRLGLPRAAAQLAAGLDRAVGARTGPTHSRPAATVGVFTPAEVTR